MKRFFRIFTLVALVAVALSSCAQQEEEDFDEVVDSAFDQWMLENYPNVELTDYGVYVEKLITVEEGESPEEEQWFYVNYTGYLINNAVYVTRDEDVATRIGTYLATTHFTPHMTYLSEYAMPEGMMLALENMKVGEKYRLYIPPTLGYIYLSASFATGYAGTSSVYTNAPLIVEVELVDVVDEPTEYEGMLVENYALERFDMIAADTVMQNFYINVTDSIAGSSVITEDSLVYLYYKGMFLDDFVFDTNIEDVAVEEDIYVYSGTYTPLSYTPSDGDLIEAFYYALTDTTKRAMKYNDTFTMVFSSDYGYSYYGSTDGSTEIQPYDPLVFEVQVLPYMGFEERPYTVYHLLNNYVEDADPGEEVYVKGYIVGCVKGTTIDSSTMQLEDSFTVTSNVLIAASASETDPDSCIAIDLSSNWDIRSDYNLVQNEDMLYMNVTFKGNLGTVLGRVGLTDLVEDDD